MHNNGSGRGSNFFNRDLILLFTIITVNLVLKIIPAIGVELGNDEVYYWTYAKFPDWSHFDHPPMVGWIIQLFSLNLLLDSELFLRAGSLILSSASIVVLFYLVKKIYSRLSAYFSVILFISSLYFNVICGLFILPDTPQIFFILLALFFLVPSVTVRIPERRDSINIIIFGMFTGLAFLSKYHSLFLWFGAGLYILFHNRLWLKKPALYISLLVTVVFMIPVIYWNISNDFISFRFHGNRISLFSNHVNLVYFLQFNLGQFFYQNPILFILFIVTFFRVFRDRLYKIKEVNFLLIYLGIPLILVFTFISLFQRTLPHWTGPAYICFIILTGEYLAANFLIRKARTIKTVVSGFCFFAVVLLLGTLQINHGIINFNSASRSDKPGKNDFTLDMYGWRQAREKFDRFLTEEGISNNNRQNVAIIADNWFPAAHLDYYIARPLNIKLIALGGIEKIHKYYWINKTRNLKSSDRIFYITDSHYYHDPEIVADCFSKIVPVDTLKISRNRKDVKYFYIYDMIGFKCETALSSPVPSF